jgi:hypothetical protein
VDFATPLAWQSIIDTCRLSTALSDLLQWEHERPDLGLALLFLYRDCLTSTNANI